MDLWFDLHRVDDLGGRAKWLLRFWLDQFTDVEDGLALRARHIVGRKYLYDFSQHTAWRKFAFFHL